ncbi:MAG: hypothetical protein GF365_01800 [Candidatus Buchananbacteria bacterium]|nr:hypothetical protein [Candidatus Buchananbacteria bacterium]
MEIRFKWAKKIKKLIQNNQFILYLIIFFIIYFVFLWVQANPTFLDPDSFYHLKISKLIAEQGPIWDFPWLQYTVLKDYYIDHHFLYHVLAIPFIKILGDFEGLKFFTVILATLFVLLSYIFFKKYKIKYAEIFTLILLFSSAFLFRISLAKAVALSLIFLFLGIYCLFKKKYWLLALISFLYVWSYGGFLLIFIAAFIFVLAKTIYHTFIAQPLWFELKNFLKLIKIKNYFKLFFKNLFSLDNLKLILAPFLGIILGLVLNPYFPKNLKFYWQQVIEIGVINYRGLVNVGGEWYPYSLAELMTNSGIVVIIFIVSVILFFIFIKKQKPPSIFFLLTSLLFFVLTLKSRRYVEYLTPNLVYFSAFTCGYILAEINFKKFLRQFKKENYILGSLLIFLIIYIAIIFPCIIIRNAYLTSQSYRGGIEYQRFEGIANYLKQKSRPGDIVMQTDWDDFPMLFYHNHQNYYIIGLDPTFMYNYDADLYNLFTEITTARKFDNLYNEVKNKFKAKYFIVDADRGQLKRNLQRYSGFVQVYEDQDGTIFKLTK